MKITGIWFIACIVLLSNWEAIEGSRGGKQLGNINIDQSNSQISSSKQKIIDLSTPGAKYYEMFAKLCLTEDQLRENGYPRSGDQPGVAVIKQFVSRAKAAPVNPNERTCIRCGKTFNLNEYNKEGNNNCKFHPKVPGSWIGRDDPSRCCQRTALSRGCKTANYHVTDFLDSNNLNGFVKTKTKTKTRDDDYVPSKKDIYGLDCQVVYTKNGLGLTHITVTYFDGSISYTALVKADSEIIDYDTERFGQEEILQQQVTRTLRDVQAMLLSFLHSKSILVGHNLERSLKALKLIHDNVIDTSILYLTKTTPPAKLPLKTIYFENLKGTMEDDSPCQTRQHGEVSMALVIHYINNYFIGL